MSADLRRGLFHLFAGWSGRYGTRFAANVVGESFCLDSFRLFFLLILLLKAMLKDQPCPGGETRVRLEMAWKWRREAAASHDDELGRDESRSVVVGSGRVGHCR